jgi:proliferating cell nuclear antigen
MPSKFNVPMSMELCTVKSSTIRLLSESLKDILTDVNIVFTSNGLKVITMDGNQVALVNLNLHADAFEYYHCPSRITAGVNMTNLYKMIKMVNNAETLILFMEQNDHVHLGIAFENKDKEKYSEIKLKLLEVDDKEIQIPNMEFDNIITMPSADFQEICRNMSNIGEVIRIKSTDKKLEFFCEGDAAKQTITFEQNNSCVSFNKNESDIEEFYELKYLNLFTKATGLCTVIQIYLKTDHPLILEYNVATLGECFFCLAPKVKETL